MSTRALCPRCAKPLPANSPVCQTCDTAPAHAAAINEGGEVRRGKRFWLPASCVTGVMVVAAAFFVFHASGAGAGSSEAAATPPPAPAVIAQPPPEKIIPLVRIANDCFSELESHAKSAGNEVSTVGLTPMFTLKPASLAVLKTNRAKLKTLDARLLEIDSTIRKTAAGLGPKLAACEAPPESRAAVLSAVKESGTELVKRCREAVAHQRRLVQQTDVILAFIEPRFKRLAAKPVQTVFANKTDQAAFDKLMKQFDTFEEQSTLVLRRIHGRSDQSKQELLVALTQPNDR